MELERLVAIGTRALEQGRAAEAVEALKAATALQPASAEIWHLLGNALAGVQRIDEARAAFRRALEIQPGLQKSLANLGRLAMDEGDLKQAIDYLGRAVELHPDAFRARASLAGAFALSGRRAEAAAQYRGALALSPEHVPALLGLSTLTLADNVSDALALAAAAVRLDRSPRASLCHGRALVRSGRPAEALLALVVAERGGLATDEVHPVRHELIDALAATRPSDVALAALAVHDPSVAVTLALALGRIDEGVRLASMLPVSSLTASVLVELGLRHAAANLADAAERFVERAIGLDPRSAIARTERAQLLAAAGRNDEALTELDDVARIDPRGLGARLLRGAVLRATGRYADAVKEFRALLNDAPDLPETYANLGPLLTFVNDVTASGAAVTQLATELRPTDAAMRGNLLLDRHYRRYGGPWDLAERHAEAGRVAPVAVPTGRANVAPTRGARLRIGYLSADLRKHAVARFLAPLLSNHDRGRFEIFCFAANDRFDDTSRAMQAQVDGWRQVAELSDRQLVELIRNDEIDILVELGGYTSGSRLASLALRAAPMQVSYLGYPNTTGLSEVDYRITDEECDPSGVTDGLGSERLLRLEGGAWCFAAPPEPLAPVPPCVERGYVTFACFNNLSKASPEYLAVCAEIVLRVPGSRLRFKSKALMDEGVVAPLRARLQALGVESERMRFGGWVGNELDAYGDVDIALDSFPYNGTTTTSEGIWMGVPAVTLQGDSHVSRVGSSLLHRVGLDDLIAQNEHDYIDRAVALASDPARLTRLRRSLRLAMADSPLGDGPQFARHFEAAMERGWTELRKPSLLPRLVPAPDGFSVVGIAHNARLAVGVDRRDRLDRAYVEGLELDVSLDVLARRADRSTTFVELDTSTGADAVRLAALATLRVIAVADSAESTSAIRLSLERSGAQIEVRPPELASGEELVAGAVVACVDPHRAIAWARSRSFVLLATESQVRGAGLAWVALHPVGSLGAFVLEDRPPLGRVGWCAPDMLAVLRARGWLVDESAAVEGTGSLENAELCDVFGAQRWMEAEPSAGPALRSWALASDATLTAAARLAALRTARSLFAAMARSGSPASLLGLARVQLELNDPAAIEQLEACERALAATSALEYGILAVSDERPVWCRDPHKRALASVWRALEKFGGWERTDRTDRLRRFGALGIPSDRMTRALEVAEYRALRAGVGSR